LASIWALAWFKNTNAREDQQLIKSLAESLSVDLRAGEIRVDAGLALAKTHIQSDFDKLVDQLENLRDTQTALQMHDPKQTTKLLSSLSVQINNGRFAGRIPIDLIDVIEEIDENEFELFFPLNQLKPLQRQAAGLDEAQGLIVRIKVDDDSREGRFCIHLHPGGHDETSADGYHNYIRIGELSAISRQTTAKASSFFGKLRKGQPDPAPSAAAVTEEEDSTLTYSFQRCKEPHKRLTFQLTQMLHNDFLDSAIGLEPLYRALNSRLDSWAQHCIICGSAFAGTGRWRSTTCKVECSRAWRQAPLDLRLTDIVDDPDAVDALLTLIYGTTMQGTFANFLPRLPMTTVLALINAFTPIPALATLKTAPSLSKSIQALGTPTEQLLCWTLHEFRGYLVSATGQFKIPNMPGIYQFLLADAHPEGGSAFTQAGKKGKVVFHGTSIDRVYQILCQGLQNLSNTSLQRSVLPNII
jgi:hypothetical protein